MSEDLTELTPEQIEAVRKSMAIFGKAISKLGKQIVATMRRARAKNPEEFKRLFGELEAALERTKESEAEALARLRSVSGSGD